MQVNRKPDIGYHATYFLIGHPMEKLKVAIAGGGIGGLTAALTLAQRGFRVSVFEQASAFTETGAGLQLSPNCTRVLHALGLREALASISFIPEAVEVREYQSGNTISRSTLGPTAIARWGYPYYHIHRADLLALLLNAARESPDIALRADCRVDAIISDGNAAQFGIDGESSEADVLIGADGIHSAVRSCLFGEVPATFTGHVAWRALVPTAVLPRGLIRPNATAWWGPGKHFVHYYVRGASLVNCVCVVEKAGWETESWTERGDLDELKADFSGWHPTISQLINHMDPDACFKWALHDRPPMAHWSHGPVTLLGDACHPTLPFLAQGAAMAIEDAAVLAACLAAATHVPAALQRYEALRRDRTASIQRGSRRNARVFHLQGVGAWLRNRAAGFAADRMTESLYSHNVYAPFAPSTAP